MIWLAIAAVWFVGGLVTMWALARAADREITKPWRAVGESPPLADGPTFHAYWRAADDDTVPLPVYRHGAPVTAKRRTVQPKWTLPLR